jgi:hypothetical protein
MFKVLRILCSKFNVQSLMFRINSRIATASYDLNHFEQPLNNLEREALNNLEP